MSFSAIYNYLYFRTPCLQKVADTFLQIMNYSRNGE